MQGEMNITLKKTNIYINIYINDRNIIESNKITLSESLDKENTQKK